MFVLKFDETVGGILDLLLDRFILHFLEDHFCRGQKPVMCERYRPLIRTTQIHLFTGFAVTAFAPARESFRRINSRGKHDHLNMSR